MNFSNLCKGATVTASSGSSQTANIVDGYIKDFPCTDCATIAVESTHAWVTLDLGTTRSLSTIVFHGDWADSTDYGTAMERYYGTQASYNHHSNAQVVQDGGTNYATMIADIYDGGA